MNCYQAKAGELAKHWYVIDATDMVVGRLAAQIAPILMGKHRPTYTPHIDTGDYVIVTNVDKVVFTGNKWQQKFYQRYSGHPGGQKEEQAWKLFKRRPERILWLAVQRMMPKNKIGRHMMAKLKLYVGTQHPHQAQAPTPLTALAGRRLRAEGRRPEAPDQRGTPGDRHGSTRGITARASRRGVAAGPARRGVAAGPARRGVAPLAHGRGRIADRSYAGPADRAVSSRARPGPSR
jgi:large subunit ribosomal protein L13